MSFPTVTTKFYTRTTSHTLCLHTKPLTLTSPYDVLIKVHAISLNYRDINILRDTNPWPTKENGIPCSDAAGEVIAIGYRVTLLKVGDKVTPIFDQKNIYGDEAEREWLGGEVDGVLSTHLIFNEAKVVKFPEYLIYQAASILPCAGLTAYNALGFNEGSLAGKVILVQGTCPIFSKFLLRGLMRVGTGGVSMLAVKLARLAGAKVILTSSSEDKLAAFRDSNLGRGQATINYRTVPAWDEEVLRLTGGLGADIVLENGGTSSLVRSIRATKRRGVVASVGYLGGVDLEAMKELLDVLIDRAVNLK
jgi:NADPH:quinone reductase-like Zn-dependent oxidoreductase